MARRVGDILLDMEPLILELTGAHDLQHGEVLNLIRGYLEIHCPGSREEYTNGGAPVFYYGPKEGVVHEVVRKNKKRSK